MASTFEQGKIVYLSLDDARECIIENIRTEYKWRRGEVSDPTLGRTDVVESNIHPGYWIPPMFGKARGNSLEEALNNLFN